MGTSCYGQWIDPLVPNETRLFSNEYKFSKPFHLVIN